MHALISVPAALTPHFHVLSGADPARVFATNDPPAGKLGSGGGTAHLLAEAWRAEGSSRPFEAWLPAARRVLLHAGGQSRRLPAYAATGKALLPLPVFRWSTGQRLDQTLMDAQMPLLEKLLEQAPSGLNTLVASGDVLVWNDSPLPPIPDVDVVCVGLWSTPETARGHGVFFTPRRRPEQFEFMLQKPTVPRIQELAAEYLFLLDVGIWLFSPRAIGVLMAKCGWSEGSQCFARGQPKGFDLYTTFGGALGRIPSSPDPEISALSCAVLPLGDAEFYHFGTSADIIRSALALQNRVHDQRRIRSPLIKPHPAIFVQNAHTPCPMDADNRDIWIENSELSPGWILRSRHVLTGIPANDWKLDLPEGTCLDFVPLSGGRFALRAYGFDDPFRGPPSDPSTRWLGAPARDWFRERGLALPVGDDLQTTPLFPVLARSDIDAAFVQWLLTPTGDDSARARWLAAEKRSAEELAALADLPALFANRRRLLDTASLPALVRHAHRSVLYQIDLAHAAAHFATSPHPLPEGRPDPVTQLFPHIHDCLFRAEVLRHRGGCGDAEEAAAFAALREAVIAPHRHRGQPPRNTALSDQVVWARSPIRLDLAGGWTDTPPYCFLHGGRVVNLAAELNGQPPIQVFARVGSEPRITLRSIDLGITQHLDSYEDIARYAELGSGFAIPRAALALAGFHPDFQAAPHRDLNSQLREFGGGIELSLLCAVPKGSGLGTSSILAATVLAALSELCGLGWDLTEIGNRTLALEQMLTSGGGWQDQFGGITRGIKLLRTNPGLDQTPELRWLPETLFTDPYHKGSLLLYYTGITRVAKGILAEIVRGMFLNRRDTLATLDALGHHALELYDLLQRSDYAALARGVARTWILNQRLDPGTNPPETQAILAAVQDYLLGAKLLGAGGGGYLLLFAKDAEAAARVRTELSVRPPNPRARFVDFNLSHSGLTITRS